jgi:4-amino-4-deoxyprephenate dehydrogenase
MISRLERKKLVQISSAVVVGINGKFGRILADKLASSGVQVFGIDLQKDPLPSLGVTKYFQGSLTKIDDELAHLLRNVDSVLLCIPVDVVVASMQSLMREVAEDAVVVDIASVKAPIVSELKKCQIKTGFLSIHPMFPPVSNFAGRSIIVSTIFKNAYSEAFLNIVKSWGAFVTEMSPEEHDNATSFVQALPHAALIAFGLTIKNSGISFSRIWQISTPIQKTLFAALLRVASNDKLTHFDLQHQNPLASNARSNLAMALKQVNEIATNTNPRDFVNLLSELDSMMIEQRTTLQKIASSIISSTQQLTFPETDKINRDLDIE